MGGNSVNLQRSLVSKESVAATCRGLIVVGKNSAPSTTRGRSVAALIVVAAVITSLIVSGPPAHAEPTAIQASASCTAQYNSAVQRANDRYEAAKSTVQARYEAAKAASRAHVEREVAAMRADIEAIETRLKELQDQVLVIPWPEFEEQQQALLDELGAAWTRLKDGSRELKAAQKAEVREAQSVRKTGLAAARAKRSDAMERARAARSACQA